MRGWEHCTFGKIALVCFCLEYLSNYKLHHFSDGMSGGPNLYMGEAKRQAGEREQTLLCVK